jgi:hypothetical protein
MLRLLLLCLSLVISVQAYPQSTPEKMALAEELVRLLQYDELQADYLKECTSPANSSTIAASAYREHPEAFGGLSPKSTYWSEVEAIYARYRERTCNYVTSERIRSIFAKKFAERASAEDLRASIAFNSSPAGRRLLSIEVSTNRDFQEYANKLLLKATEDAEDQYQKEIAVVVGKFHAAPR